MPLFWIVPVLVVVSVPPVIVAPLSSTTEPDPSARMEPPVLVNPPTRWSEPPAVASSVPVLVVPPLACTVRVWDTLASMVPWLVSVNWLSPTKPAPWMVAPDETTRTLLPALPKMKFSMLLLIVIVPVPLSVTVLAPTMSSVSLPAEFMAIVPLLAIEPTPAVPAIVNASALLIPRVWLLLSRVRLLIVMATLSVTSELPPAPPMSTL